MNRQTALRELPAVHRLLELPETKARLGSYPFKFVSEAFAKVLENLRDLWRDGEPSAKVWHEATAPESLIAAAEAHLKEYFQPHLRHVVNLTGVVIHTNLGRAPLSARAIDAVCEVAKGYSNLEYDLSIGERGSRYSHVERLLCRVTGAQAAMVVNNNAAAVLLVLHELGQGGEAIVSRGQLVEIGGSFRISEIMRESGVDLVEVGTTNRTRISDYRRAVTDRTKLLLRVHTSNFRIVGFTEEPKREELTTLAHEHQLPVYEDLGSGCVFDYKAHGVGDELPVSDSLAAGVDVVSFSGDKLLGAAQAGIIVGKKSYIEQLKRNQLTRALRVDKMTLAALEATLIAHLDDASVQEEVPVVRMLTIPLSHLCERAQDVLTRIQACPQILQVMDAVTREEVSKVGGGALPTEELPTFVLELSSRRVSAQQLCNALRRIPDVPLVARLQDERVVLDMRTLLPGEEKLVVAGLRAVAQRWLNRPTSR